MIFGALFAVLAATGAALAASSSTLPCQITDVGIGRVRPGMTLRDARLAVPQATFERSEAIDDVAVIEAWIGKEEILHSELAGNFPTGDLSDSIQLRSLETYNKRCTDESGIGPGTSLQDAAERLGGLKEIVRDDQKRQFAVFRNQAKGRWYRISYSGIFAENSPRRTMQFQADASIIGVGVAGSSTE